MVQVGSTNITEFNYRYNDDNEAHVMYRVGVREGEEVGGVIERMRAGGYKTEDFTENDLAKRYSRSQVGEMGKMAEWQNGRREEMQYGTMPEVCECNWVL